MRVDSIPAIGFWSCGGADFAAQDHLPALNLNRGIKLRLARQPAWCKTPVIHADLLIILIPPVFFFHYFQNVKMFFFFAVGFDNSGGYVLLPSIKP